MHYQTREGDRSENGTSFAAPSVSNVGAVLLSFGVPTAVEVKQRILVSVDYSDQLKDKVVSGGVLNIEKAVSLGDDVLQDQNGQISYFTCDRELKLCKDDEDKRTQIVCAR